MNDSEINQELQRLQTDIKNKLINGRDGLYTAEHLPEKSHVGLAHTLIAYHGALEDHFRASLVTKVPISDRELILDTTETKWKDLLQLGKEYLQLSQKDADLINEANYYRNNQSAHGDKFNWVESRLRLYVTLVENWCAKEIIFLDKELVHQVPQPQSLGQKPGTQSSIPKPYQQPNPQYTPVQDFWDTRIGGTTKLIIVLALLCLLLGCCNVLLDNILF